MAVNIIEGKAVSAPRRNPYAGDMMSSTPAATFKTPAQIAEYVASLEASVGGMQNIELAYKHCMAVFNTQFFTQERDSDLKSALTQFLVSKFKARNKLWVKIANRDSSVLNLL